MKITDKKNLEHMEGLTNTKSTQKKGQTSKVSDNSSVGKTSSLDELGSAKVELSERAQDMKKIRSAIDATPDVDDAKVAKFKAMIAKGEYKVDAKKVADKMVDEHAKMDLFKPDTE
jgi:negative regulator of flagellin synthesis FlgM